MTDEQRAPACGCATAACCGPVPSPTCSFCPQMPLSTATRADVRLVMIGGRMRYGDAHYACAIAPASQWVEVGVDGRSKVMDRRLAALLGARRACRSQASTYPRTAGERHDPRMFRPL